MRKLSATTAFSVALFVVMAAAAVLLAQEDRTGAILVECGHPGAQVFLDGKEHASRLISGLRVGKHQLVAIAPGMAVFAQSVKVVAGVTAKVTIRFEPLSGSLSVTTDPPGAKVSIDGREVGTSPVDIEKVAQGKHVITAAKPGFATREKEIVVGYGDELSVFLRMKKKDATFSVFSFPSGADVFLDGKKMGVTPLRVKNVPPGSYTLRVEKGKGCIHEEAVTIQAGKDMALDVTLPLPGAILRLDPGPVGRKLHIDRRLFAQLKTRRISVPPGEHLLSFTGWKGTVLHQCSLKLEKGKSYPVAFKPKFRFISQFKGHEGSLLALAFAQDGKTLASASKDGTVRLWDVGSKKELLVIRAHPPGAKAVAFGPQGKRIASGGWDKTVKVWDVATGRKLREFDVKSSVQSVAWSRDGRYFAAGCNKGVLKVWDVEKNWKITVLRGHEDVVNSLTFDPGGSTLVSGSADGRVILWKTTGGWEAEKLSETKPVKTVQVSGNGEFLITGCDGGEVFIRKLDRLGSVRMIKAQPNLVLSLARGWGTVFAAGGDSEKVTIIDAEAGTLLKLGEMKSSATALAFDSQGRYLAIGANNGVIYFWHAE